ncbi:unnamed protein product [Vicia faba]|uniref:Uncharacterized protein n=1 Tax=Vicia faba TaxID=3906 RepID=A0AAV1A0G5_VICFA|nr:unnamed protein product [Vicia faba]
MATPSISIHITSLSPNHGWGTISNQVVIQMSSLIDTPRKNIKKICKVITSFKTKQQKELSTTSKNIKKIYKVMHSYLKKMKRPEDEKCLWKKTILMGEKCQPLEFSGAIFYDSEGNQLSEPPKIPRKSPLIN